MMVNHVTVGSRVCVQLKSGEILEGTVGSNYETDDAATLKHRSVSLELYDVHCGHTREPEESVYIQKDVVVYQPEIQHISTLSPVIIPAANQHQGQTSPVIPAANQHQGGTSPGIPAANQHQGQTSPVIPAANQHEGDTSPVIPTANQHQDSISRADHVIVTLHNGEVFRGCVVSFQPHKITIHNDSDDSVDSNDQMVTLYRREIATITKTSVRPPVTVTVAANCQPSPQQCGVDFDRCRQLTTDYVYVKCVGDATCQRMDDVIVEQLRSSQCVAIATLGSTFNALRPFSLIVVGTVRTIYVFDVLNSGATTTAAHTIPHELLALLHCADTVKICHDCAPLQHYLARNRLAHAQNVFDTQVADAYLKRTIGSREGRDLAVCLQEYLNVPPAYVEMALEQSINDDYWLDRPLQRSQRSNSAKLILACQLVVYLSPLRRRMLELMLPDYGAMLASKISNATKM